MWCSNCQQDVPGLGSSSAGCPRCGKCSAETPTAIDQSTPTRQLPPEFSSTSPVTATTVKRVLHLPPLSNDDWALEAELRGVQRLVKSLKARDDHRPIAPAAPQQFHSVAVDSRSSAAPSSSPQQPRTHTAAWLILSLGLAVFACGAVLLAWSLVAQRPDLWPVGMPLTLIGQAGLILGLVLQLDGLWTTSRSTAAALSELDGELKNVRQATSLLSTSHSSGAQSFYLHLAEGASPQLLLADLKGQMDLLAQQMARK
jgi:hypothetical protein